MKSRLRSTAVRYGALSVSFTLARFALGQAALPPFQVGTISVTLSQVANGLTAPVDVRSVPVGVNQLAVTDQAGKIQIFQNGVAQGTLLDVSGRLAPFRTNANGISYDERGLLGFAYDPDFNATGSAGFHKVYTYTTETNASGTADFTPPSGGTIDHHGVIAEWTVSAANLNVVDTSTRREILSVAHPNFNHDGGPFAFGPDKQLYFSLGDGGTANDTGNGHVAITGNAQDTSTTNLWGKILRIDPHGNNSANGKYGIPTDNPFANTPGKAKEIYAYGLRNPYRISFDRSNGQLIAADVGQNNVEEIDRIISGGNYGWHTKEGTYTFDPTTGNVLVNTPGLPAGLIDPLAEYDHSQGIAIIGGFVYHGSLLPQLQGKYVFGDFSTSFGAPGGRLLYADLSTGQISEFLNGLKGKSPLFLKGFGEDVNGELFVSGSSILGPSGTAGIVYALVPEPTSLGLLAATGLLLARRRRTR